MKKYCSSKPTTLAKPKLWGPKPQESRSEISFWAVSRLWWPGRHSTAWTKRLTLHSATEKVTLKKKSQEWTQLKGLEAPVHFFNFPLRAAAAGLGSQGLGESVGRCQVEPKTASRRKLCLKAHWTAQKGSAAAVQGKSRCKAAGPKAGVKVVVMGTEWHLDKTPESLEHRNQDALPGPQRGFWDASLPQRQRASLCKAVFLCLTTCIWKWTYLESQTKRN